MIVALMFLAFTGWIYWLMYRPARPSRGTPTGPGLAADPDPWHSTHSAWTALDERQLTRLLADSAPGGQISGLGQGG